MSTQVIQIPSRPIEPFVSAEKAAEFISASPKTVMRLAREGRIPAHPFGDGLQRRHWRFLLSELDAWLRARNNASCSTSAVERGA